MFAAGSGPEVADAVADRCFPVGRYANPELDGRRIEHGEVRAGAKHLPIAPAKQVFNHAHLYGFIIVVAQCDFEIFILLFGGRSAEISRYPFTGDVEHISDIQEQVLALRGVVDRFLAD